MKRLFSLVLTGALALTLAASAHAAAAAQLVRAFVYQDTLYTYVDISGTDQPITKADAEIAGQTFPASGTLETVRQAGFPVTWMLLVDNSNSMPPFREEAVAFVQALAAGSVENTRFLLASFGDAFTLLAEDVPPERLAAKMGEIPMDETVTRLHSSISQALDYFDTLPREGTELRGLIVLTDAVQYDPGAAVTQEELLSRITASDVMVHSVGFGTDASSLESLALLAEASAGTHQVIGSQLSPADAAAALADEAGSLYVTGFALSGLAPSGETASVSVTFASGSELVCRGTAEVAFPASGEEAAVPEEEPAVLPDAHPQLPPSGASSSGQAAQPAGEEGASDSGAGLLPAAIGAVVLAVAVIAAAVLVVRRRTSASASQDSPAPAAAEPPAAGDGQDQGIFLRLEVLQGAYLGQSLELTLRRELWVGRDPACDIPFADSAVSRRNSRIFLANDAVYIEDQDSQNGTCVNGEPLSTARLLRSGDEITVGGQVSFRLKF